MEYSSSKNKKADTDKNLHEEAEDKNFHTDPLGSYTGVPEDGGKPVQDGDDI